MTPVLLDTGVIVALLDRTEREHTVCVSSVAGLSQPLVTCEAVIAESCYLLRKIPGASEAVLQNVARGIFQIPLKLSESAEAVERILRKYSDLPADLADACLVHLAEVVNSGSILTLDRDFQSYRWRKDKPFDLLIPL